LWCNKASIFVRTDFARMSNIMRQCPLSLILFLLLGLVQRTDAQNLPWSISAGASATLAFSPSAPLQIQGLSTPPVASFSSSPTAVPTFSLDAAMGITSTISLGIRSAITPATIRFMAEERLPVAVNNEVVLATINHRRDVSVKFLAADAFVRLPVVGMLAADAAAGVTMPLGVRAVQRQQLVDPPGLRLPDGSIEQETGRTTLSPSVTPSIALRLIASIPVGNDVTLEPGIGVRQILASIGSGDGWTPAFADVGIAIRFALGSAQEQTQVLPPRPDTIALPIVMAPDTITVDDTVTVAQADGTGAVLFDRRTIETDGPRIRVTNRWKRILPLPAAVLEASVRVRLGDRSDLQDAALKLVRVHRTRTISVVPALVFVEGTDRLRPEYSATTTGRPAIFSVPDELAALARSNTPNIVLLGWHNGSNASMALAERRLRTARTFLQRRVRNGTINVASNLRLTDAAALWNAVGIGGAGDSLTTVTIRDTITVTTLPTLVIEPDVVADAGIGRWQCSVLDAADTVRLFRGIGAVPERLEWNMADNMDAMQALERPVRIILDVHDSDGRMAVSEPAVVRVKAAGPLSEIEPSQLRTEELRAIVGQAANGGQANGTMMEPAAAVEALSGGDSQIASILLAMWGSGVRAVYRVNEERRP
jgi:hypothetical protein